ncbi:Uncharacterised protein [Cedecea neteri]|uniref:Uncharacterized protein n=1 Tax=Cedecea neteri TaxID=158822 RepID=A0A2X3J2R9_9ENTR|nr:Uncharacterised protein [Cedecea neteri]
MSEVILVNHQVKFEPNRNTLSSMSLPERKITLPSSSSRCLKVLLSKQGDVVTIKQFHKLVLGEEQNDSFRQHHLSEYLYYQKSIDCRRSR